MIFSDDRHHLHSGIFTLLGDQKETFLVTLCEENCAGLGSVIGLPGWRGFLFNTAALALFNGIFRGAGAIFRSCVCRRLNILLAVGAVAVRVEYFA
jgi:hypothetical protein